MPEVRAAEPALLLPFAALIAAAFSLGCAGSLNASGEPQTRARTVCTLDLEGNTQRCQEEEDASNLDMQWETARVHCLLAAEGRYVNCMVAKAPDSMHDMLLEMLRKARPKPLLVEGKPVDTQVTLVFRVRHRFP